MQGLTRTLVLASCALVAVAAAPVADSAVRSDGAAARHAVHRAAPRVVVRALPHGARATYRGRARGGVLFILDGLAVARDRTRPYRLTLHDLARSSHMVRHSLVVRSLRSGRRIGFAAIPLAAPVAMRAAAVRRLAAAAAGHRLSVTITSQPGNPTTSTDATFAWTFTGAAHPTERCSLDGGAFAPCSSPTSYSGLAQGQHTFTIQITRRSVTRSDSATWTIEGVSAPPSVSLVDQPASQTPDTSALFSWTSQGADTTTCSLDAAAATPCSSPIGYTNLAVGSHTFTVTVANGTGSDSATASWTITAAPPPPPPPPPSGPCGVTTASGGYQHVVWIVMENHSYGQVLDPAVAPYTAALAGNCGLATNFSAEGHPSLPNYVAMTSGSTQGITDDAGPSSHPLAAASIFSQTAGDWTALEESMPSACALSDSGLYAVRHNPAAYYTGIRSECATNDVPLGATPDLSASFTFITPNLCHDTHDCSVATGDAWLASFLPQVLSSPEYLSGTTAVFITWDEDDGSAGNHIATLVIAPSVAAGTRSSVSFNHYSMLRTTEELLGLPLLGNAASASSMRGAFNL